MVRSFTLFIYFSIFMVVPRIVSAQEQTAAPDVSVADSLIRENSGLKAEIENLRNEILELKKEAEQQKKLAQDNLKLANLKQQELNKMREECDENKNLANQSKMAADRARMDAERQQQAGMQQLTLLKKQKEEAEAKLAEALKEIESLKNKSGGGDQ